MTNHVSRFLKWWWKGHDGLSRVCAVIIIAWVIAIVNTIWFGASVLFMFAHIIVIGIIGAVLYKTWNYCVGQWKRYRYEMPTKDELILNRLRGEGTQEIPDESE